MLTHVYYSRAHDGFILQEQSGNDNALEHDHPRSTLLITQEPLAYILDTIPKGNWAEE